MCIRSSKEHITWVLQIERDFIAEYKTEYLGGGGGLDTQHSIELSDIKKHIMHRIFFFGQNYQDLPG